MSQTESAGHYTMRDPGHTTYKTSIDTAPLRHTHTHDTDKREREHTHSRVVCKVYVHNVESMLRVMTRLHGQARSVSHTYIHTLLSVHCLHSLQRDAAVALLRSEPHRGAVRRRSSSVTSCAYLHTARSTARHTRRARRAAPSTVLWPSGAQARTVCRARRAARARRVRGRAPSAGCDPGPDDIGRSGP